MGLAVFLEAGVSDPLFGVCFPVLTCDTCGEPITDWGMGVVYYLEPEEGQRLIPVTVYHKRECDPWVLKRTGMPPAKWLELHNYVSELLKGKGKVP